MPIYTFKPGAFTSRQVVEAMNANLWAIPLCEQDQANPTFTKNVPWMVGCALPVYLSTKKSNSL